MLHELLFALNGHDGHIFTLQSGEFKVNASLDWFHPAEAGILNKLLELATCVWSVQNFITEHRNTSVIAAVAVSPSAEITSSGEAKLHGLYLEALCDGLEAALAPYKLTLASLEKVILKAGGHTQLPTIQHQMMAFHPMLRALALLVDQVTLQRPHGCLILDVVYRATLSGVARVREALQDVLFECHKVFYKQLLAWILKGSLHDPFQEFIIEQVEVAETLSVGSSSIVSNNSSEDSMNARFPPHQNGGQDQLLQLSSNKASSARCRLRADKIPSHISFAVAEKIFFIGESIQLFEVDNAATGVTDPAQQNIACSAAAKKDVLKEEETQLYNQLASLRDTKEFRVADFERFVDSVRETVSKHLHSLILEKSDLKHELQLVRDLFLLGRGELFQVFIEEADRFLKNPPTAATQHDVNEAFAMACRIGLPGADEGILRKIKVKVTLKTKVKLIQPKGGAGGGGSSSSNSPPSGWDCLSLQYAAPWPLHLILTPSNIDTYNEILKMFLRVRRVQRLLQESWFKDAKEKKAPTPGKDGGLRQLRAHMLFVVNNLQHYLMVDVLESQYALLTSRLDASSNFEEIRHAHDVFLNSVVTFTFIRNDKLSACLNGLLQACQDHCLHNDDEAAEVVATTFARQSGLLFKILSTIQNRSSGSQLAQLMLRIDYNRYFSKHGHEVNTATTKQTVN